MVPFTDTNTGGVQENFPDRWGSLLFSVSRVLGVWESKLPKLYCDNFYSINAVIIKWGHILYIQDTHLGVAVLLHVWPIFSLSNNFKASATYCSHQPFWGLMGAHYCTSFNECSTLICPCLNEALHWFSSEKAQGQNH